MIRKTDDPELIFETGVSQILADTPERVIARLAALPQEPQGCVRPAPPKVEFRELPDGAMAFRVRGGSAQVKGVIGGGESDTQVQARAGIGNLALLGWCVVVAVFVVVLNSVLYGRTLVPPVLCAAMIALPSMGALWLGLLYQRSRLLLLVEKALRG
jgi:hypothetical protein